MVVDINHIVIAGRLTRDPEFRSTSTGRGVAGFGLAYNRRVQDRQTGEYNEEADFFEVQAWERRADFARDYLRKGCAVLVQGRLRQERWTDQQTQQPRHKVVIVADRLQFGESRAEAEARAASGGRSAPPGPDETPDRDRAVDEERASGQSGSTSDDLPF